MKILSQNKKAFHDYDILDTLEAGIVLTGDEVKSIRAGQASMIGAFATIHQGELFLINMQITPYEKAYIQKEGAERRSRKLLIHRRQLSKLIGEMSLKGVTLIPLKLYLNERNKIKVELGIAKHKKAAGKKQDLKERDIKRETARELRGKYKYD